MAPKITDMNLEIHKQKRDYKSYMEAYDSLLKNSEEASNLKKIKIKILRNFTVEPLLPFFTVDLSTFGIELKVSLGGFDTVAQNVFEMEFDENEFDFVLIFNVLQNLSPILEKDFLLYDSKDISSEIDRVAQFYKNLLTVLRKKTKLPIIVNTFPIPNHPLKRLADAKSEPSQIEAILNLNSKIKILAQEFESVTVLDVFNICFRTGGEKSIDLRMWKVSQNPFSVDGMSAISVEISRVISSSLFTRKKCLILDCDNVLWNGVSGEEGIKSFNNEIQQMALNLHAGGTLLALASKNDEKFILETLESDDRNLLKPQYLSAWKINWENKADNIKKISEQLNIGLDSIVFIDDSEYECKLVNELLPEVTVIRFKGNEYLFCEDLILSGLFDTINLTEEDFKRNQTYKYDNERVKILGASQSYDDFLNNLGIEVEINRASIENLNRIHQLVQKTNQFNLTTTRLSEAQINQMIIDNNYRIFTLRAKDKVSDLGLVGVAILKSASEYLHIENLILSCRALGRGIEDAFMSVIKNYAAAQKFKIVKGQFIRTAKNDQVSGYYKKQNFIPIKYENHDYFEFAINETKYHSPKYVKVIDNVKEMVNESK
jgi:FkbH-like protein